MFAERKTREKTCFRGWGQFIIICTNTNMFSDRRARVFGLVLGGISFVVWWFIRLPHQRRRHSVFGEFVLGFASLYSRYGSRNNLRGQRLNSLPKTNGLAIVTNIFCFFTKLNKYQESVINGKKISKSGAAPFLVKKNIGKK